MKFTIAASALAFAASVAATPTWWPSQGGCLNQASADLLLWRFTQAFQHLNSDLGSANQTLEILIANNFQEISDSILSLEGRPLGGASTESKADYINGLISNPPSTGITTIQAAPIGCSQLLWQWKFTGVGSAQQEVKGFNVFQLNQQGQIQTLFVEFNSIAWGLDTGYQIVFPQGPPPS